MNIDSSVSETAPENWVINIQKMLIEEKAEEIPVCILKVRKMLRDIKPEDYTPRLIGLGPYHHWRGDLYEMELYKLIAAKKAVAQSDEEAVQTLERLAKGLTKEHIAQIRACYDRYLEVKDDELAWMMVIDSIFLLEFLQVFVHKREIYWRSHKRMSYLVDRSQSAYHSILRDMMMLENQIPVIVLDHIFSDSDLNTITQREGDSLLQLLTATCKKLSPFHHLEETCFHSTNDMPLHLLDLLYYMIVPRDQLPQSIRLEDCPHPDDEKLPSKDEQATMASGQGRSYFCLSNINFADASVHLLEKINLQGVHTGPCRVITKFLGFLLPFLSSRTENPSSGGGQNEAPTIEEIQIPTVSDLLDVGVKFCPTPTDGRYITSCISFNRRTRKFHLPIIDIDDNTEVIMRNLVAYEAAAISGPLVLARYTELMNGIIDTAEDVRLLRKKGVIKRHLKSDKDVADMWNLMRRSIRLSHVPSIDKAIKEVNEYYASKKRVRFYRFTKDCMFCAWKIMMLLFVLLLLMLMLIQSFCDVYKCPRIVAAIDRSGTQGSN